MWLPITSPADTTDFIPFANASHITSDATNHGSAAATHTADAATSVGDTKCAADINDVAPTANIKDDITSSDDTAHPPQTLLMMSLNLTIAEDKRPNQYPSTNTLIRLTELVLALNFSFNSSHFLHTKGVVMSTHTGQNYSCFFVRYVEQSLFHCCTGTILHLFLHYIDDCISAASSSSHEELEQFINFINTFRRTLKISWTISDTSLSFLDLCLHLWDCSLRDSLIRSKLPTSQITPGTIPCNRRRFYMCPYTSPLTSIQ
eukprot:g33070.t1